MCVSCGSNEERYWGDLVSVQAGEQLLQRRRVLRVALIQRFLGTSKLKLRSVPGGLTYVLSDIKGTSMVLKGLEDVWRAADVLSPHTQIDPLQSAVLDRGR